MCAHQPAQEQKNYKLFTNVTFYNTFSAFLRLNVNCLNFNRKPANSKVQGRQEAGEGMQAITTKRAKVAGGGYKSNHLAYLFNVHTEL